MFGIQCENCGKPMADYQAMGRGNERFCRECFYEVHPDACAVCGADDAALDEDSGEYLCARCMCARYDMEYDGDVWVCDACGMDFADIGEDKSRCPACGQPLRAVPSYTNRRSEDHARE
jgi:predicted amidophosphoribosyltransferase